MHSPMTSLDSRRVHPSNKSVVGPSGIRGPRYDSSACMQCHLEHDRPDDSVDRIVKEPGSVGPLQTGCTRSAIPEKQFGRRSAGDLPKVPLCIGIKSFRLLTISGKTERFRFFPNDGLFPGSSGCSAGPISSGAARVRRHSGGGRTAWKAGSPTEGRPPGELDGPRTPFPIAGVTLRRHSRLPSSGDLTSSLRHRDPKLRGCRASS